MRWWAIPAVAMLTGCGPAETGVNSPSRLEEAGPDSCGVADHETLVGEPLSAFDQTALDQPVRIIPPGGIVTMEYNPRRLNVDLDGNSNIVRFWCG